MKKINNLIKTLLIFFISMGFLHFSANAQVFCTPSSLAGNIAGYTGSFQQMPSVAAGQAYYWTTTLTAGIPYTWSNCTAQGGTNSDTYMRIYNSANAIVASADDNCGVNPTVTYTPAVSGVYYVHLAQYSCGNLATSQIVSYMAVLPPAPTIASFAPASVCNNGGTVVITGTNFTGATAVTIGGTPAQSFVINNATQITAIVGAGTTGTIAVTTLGGTATSVGTLTVNQSPAAPTSTAATPNTICMGGTAVLSAVTPAGGPTTVFTETFANNTQGWTLDTEWQIGSATASVCGGYGNQDPATDVTPTPDNGIAGVVIGGCATTALHAPYYLTSPIINLSGLTNATLNFYRWLNSDYTPYMNNTVEVFNGASWVTIWSSGGAPGILDASWQFQTFNVTPYINANFRVRFGKTVGSGGAFTVSSWNLDDITITTNIPAPTLLWTGQANIATPTLATSDVTPTVAGAHTYTITVTAANGCTSSASTTLNVTPTASQPTLVTATPATICAGGTSQLNSTATVGSTQTWYTVPTGGVAIGTSLSGANFAVSPGATTTYYVETSSNIAGSQTFNYTGSMQTFTVPAGVTSMTVDVRGAQGGDANGTGGLGARMTGTLAVTPGEVLSILVGQKPTANGGGGGTFVVGPANTPLVIAGGGGGGAGACCGVTHNGGDGLIINDGGAGINASGSGGPGGTGGNGGAAFGGNGQQSGAGGGFLTSGGAGTGVTGGLSYLLGGAGGDRKSVV